MKYPHIFFRVCLSVIFILTIGLLPHHHHHGDFCWAVEEIHNHPHGGAAHEKDCPTDPCDDTSCFLQAMKTFVQTERPNMTSPVTFISVIAQEFRFSPVFEYIQKSGITHTGYRPIHTVLSSHSLRGPPASFCL